MPNLSKTDQFDAGRSMASANNSIDQASKNRIEASRRKKALEHYRKLRQRDWDKYTKGRAKFTIYNPRHLKPSSSQKNIPRPVRPSKRKSPALTTSNNKQYSVDSRTQWIELNQIKSFHCMKYRLTGRYPSPKVCERSAQEKFDKCTTKYEWGTASLSSCIKNALE